MPPPQPLRQALRAATQTEHKALEAQPLMRRLLSPELTIEQYGQILLAQRAYYQSVEPVLWPFERQLRERLPESGYRYHSRLPALERDCRQLTLPEEEVGGAWVFRPQSAEQALGALYVLEGASQGGRIISNRLGQVLALNGENGAAFFSSGSEGVGWASLCRWLEALPCEEPWQQAITGARKTFTAFHTHFDHWQRRTSGRN